jgi:hypothetical protein
MFPIEWGMWGDSTGRLGVGRGTIGLREDRGVETPVASDRLYRCGTLSSSPI